MQSDHIVRIEAAGIDVHSLDAKQVEIVDPLSLESRMERINSFLDSPTKVIEVEVAGEPRVVGVAEAGEAAVLVAPTVSVVEFFSPNPTSVSQLVQSVMLPSRIVISALRIPFKIAMKGKRRPTWTTEMEVLVAAFRSACRNAPRDLSLLRAWTDLEIPSLLLPKGASLYETSIHGMRIEWVFPLSLKLSPTQDWSTTFFPYSGFVFSNAHVLEWSKTHPIVLYLHGGGHALCGSHTHRNIVAAFAVQDVILCVPNYRRPPDVSIIDAVDDCISTYRHLLDVIGIPSSRIAIMGDSAGGALSVLTLCKIRDSTHIPPPACGVLISPWVELNDVGIAGEAAKGNIMPAHDYLPRDALVMISKLVIGSLRPDDPRINPMSADCRGLPPILIHVGELELLFDQITHFYEKLKEESVDVRMKIWIDSVHVPHVFTAVNEEAVRAVRHAVEYIKKATLVS